MVAPPKIVLEDRGIDTIALYQAAILFGPDVDDQGTWELAQQIHATAEFWRPKPDLVRLILDDLDDLDACQRRYAERVGRPMAADARHLVTRVARLYQRQADHEPERFRIVHRTGRTEQDVLGELAQLVLEGIGEHR
jgi:dTMP kinase